LTVAVRVRHLRRRRLLVRKLRVRQRQRQLTRLQQQRHPAVVLLRRYLAVMQRRRLQLRPLRLQQW
jgi:hypothetical protein